MLYAMLCAVPGSGAGALTVVTPPPVEVLELPEEAVCVTAAMSDGLTVAGFATTPQIRKQMWEQMLRGFAIHALLVDGVLAATNGNGRSSNAK